MPANKDEKQKTINRKLKTENPASQKTQLYRATQTSGMVYRSFLIDHHFF